MSPNDLVQQMKWRYAVKRFDPTKKISETDWAALEESLVLTPSSYGLQPWKFLVIRDMELRKRLTPLSWRQKQVEECSHYVVFAAKVTVDEAYVNQFIDYVAKTRNTTADTLAGYKKGIIGDLINGPRSKTIAHWAALQSYIALGNLMTSAAMLGIDTCPMEGIEPEKYDEVLGLKDSGYATRVACAVGYRSAEDKYSQATKVRFSKSDLIQHL